MADYVLLEQSELNNQVRIVVHSTVPTGSNQAGMTWKDALVASVDTTSRVPAALLPAGRQTALDAGDLYEWELSFEDDANKTPANRLAALEAEIASRESAELQRMANRLRYYGHVGSI